MLKSFVLIMCFPIFLIETYIHALSQKTHISVNYIDSNICHGISLKKPSGNAWGLVPASPVSEVNRNAML